MKEQSTRYQIMKGTLIGLLGTMALAMELSAATTTIGRWNFNSAPPDSSVSTGSTAPSVGTGTASLVGGATGQFAAGSGGDPGSDNSAWNTAGYLSLIHISEPTRLLSISYAVFC